MGNDNTVQRFPYVGGTYDTSFDTSLQFIPLQATKNMNFFFFSYVVSYDFQFIICWKDNEQLTFFNNTY